jgi:very-short-patch-repair endonuclease
MAGFWAELPAGRVVRLTGESPEAIASAFEPMPDDAPAVVQCRLSADPSSARTAAAVLDRLEAAALDLYPAWLPGAEVIEGPGGAGIAAVRVLALERAAASPQFGPFLADLAARSLTGEPGRSERFRPEVRAAGLARAVADSYRRSQLALLVQRPEALDPASERAAATACEWLAHHGGFAVWLTGAGWRTDGRLPTVSVRLTDRAVDSASRNGSSPYPQSPAATVVRLPAVAGKPHPASRSERALEAALAKHPWASGRVWNRTFRPDPLTNPIRVDLMWPDERCAIEIDGDEHRGIQHYEDDRRRDVHLQIAGFAVLRYTNTQIERDIAAVLSQLEQFITNRRLGKDSHGR